MRATCVDIHNVLSMKTPISLTNDCGVISHPHTLIASTVGGALQQSAQKTNASVFATFGIKVMVHHPPFDVNCASLDFSESTSCVSSAYKMILNCMLGEYRANRHAVYSKQQGPKNRPLRHTTTQLSLTRYGIVDDFSPPSCWTGKTSPMRVIFFD